MKYSNIFVLGAIAAMSLGVATPSFAVTEETCVSDCEEPEPPAKAKGNNGLGNGDQPAPGNSLNNNKAENQVGNPGHKSGKPQESD